MSAMEVAKRWSDACAQNSVIIACQARERALKDFGISTDKRLARLISVKFTREATKQFCGGVGENVDFVCDCIHEAEIEADNPMPPSHAFSDWVSSEPNLEAMHREATSRHTEIVRQAMHDRAYAASNYRLRDAIYRAICCTAPYAPCRAILELSHKLDISFQSIIIAHAVGKDWEIQDCHKSTTVVSLARMMYDSKDFSTMPILSDALQDEGNDCDELIYHMKTAPPEHWFRGCFPLDMILGLRK
jgi:hypothetical protein